MIASSSSSTLSPDSSFSEENIPRGDEGEEANLRKYLVSGAEMLLFHHENAVFQNNLRGFESSSHFRKAREVTSRREATDERFGTGFCAFWYYPN